MSAGMDGYRPPMNDGVTLIQRPRMIVTLSDR